MYSTIIYGKGRKRKFDQRRGQEDKEQHYITRGSGEPVSLTWHK